MPQYLTRRHTLQAALQLDGPAPSHPYRNIRNNSQPEKSPFFLACLFDTLLCIYAATRVNDITDSYRDGESRHQPHNVFLRLRDAVAAVPAANHVSGPRHRHSDLTTLRQQQRHGRKACAGCLFLVGGQRVLSCVRLSLPVSQG